MCFSSFLPILKHVGTHLHIHVGQNEPECKGKKVNHEEKLENTDSSRGKKMMFISF